MNETDILTIVQQELDNTSPIKDLDEALNYYLGGPNGTELVGRSQVVSTDVADVVEWVMPQLMKSFTQNNEVVVFDPIHAGDERQAEIESEYTYDIIMKENDGFLILHEFIKDALIQRSGILKVFYKKERQVEFRHYTGLSAQEVMLIKQTPGTTITAISPSGDPLKQLFDAKITATYTSGKIHVESVAPEDFRVNSDHNSIKLENARFVAHLLRKRISDLRKEGISEDILAQLKTSSELRNEGRFSAQGETVSPLTDYLDEASREVDIVEAYTFLDIDNDGLVEYCKITAGGDELQMSTIISIEPLDYCPWVSTSPILMSHKHQGLSIYDRLKELQDQKTSLLRNVFDNFYYMNNRRIGAVEGRVNMDDLLVSRPGGVVRLKTSDAIVPIDIATMDGSGQQLLEYLDGVRADKSGVNPEFGTAEHKTGERVGSEGVEKLLTAREELVGLIVRVIAETGIKPLCIKIRDLLVRHSDAIVDYKFRDEWVQINAATWSKRSKCTVRVGTGASNNIARLGAIQKLLEIDEKIMSMPGQALLKPEQIYAKLNDFCKFSGLNSAAKYYIDPASPQGTQFAQEQSQQQAEQQKQQLEMQAALAQAQIKIAEAEQSKVAVMAKNNDLQAQLTAAKTAYENKIAQLEIEIKQAKTISDDSSKANDLKFKYDELETKTAVELVKIEATAKQQQDENFKQNKKAVEENGD